MQPVHVEDFAALAVEQGKHRENLAINAVGPETFTYRELVETIGDGIGRRRPIVSVPPQLGYLASKPVNWLTGDVLITRDEIRGLMENLLYVEGAAPVGKTRLSEYARTNAETLGRSYASELERRRNRRN